MVLWFSGSVSPVLWFSGSSLVLILRFSGSLGLCFTGSLVSDSRVYGSLVSWFPGFLALWLSGSVVL